MSNKFGRVLFKRREAKITKSRLHGRIIKTYYKDGRLHELHATKGWRSYRSA